MKNLENLTGKIIRKSANGFADNANFDVAVDAANIEKIIATFELDAQELLNNVTEGNGGSYIKLGGLTLLVSPSGEVSGVRVFRHHSNDAVGDTVSLSIASHEAGESSPKGDFTWSKAGYNVVAFNEAATGRKTLKAEKLDMFIKLAGGRREAALLMAETMGLSTLASTPAPKPVATEEKSSVELV